MEEKKLDDKDFQNNMLEKAKIILTQNNRAPIPIVAAKNISNETKNFFINPSKDFDAYTDWYIKEKMLGYLQALYTVVSDINWDGDIKTFSVLVSAFTYYDQPQKFRDYCNGVQEFGKVAIFASLKKDKNMK